ncbi:MAG: type II secretion system protein GspE, partial [Desulfobacula sp.]|nr:type II secretion system protein GspE [Desulfobacula sp.]
MIDQFLKIIENKKVLSKEECEKIRASFEKNPSRLTESIVETKLVSENEVLEVLDRIYALPYVANLSMENVINDWTALIPRKFLKKFNIVPLIQGNDNRINGKNRSIIAINEPSNLCCVDDVAAVLDLDFYSMVLAPKNQILSAINILYDQSGESAQQLVDDMEDSE